MGGWVSYLGHRGRELLVHVDRLKRRRGTRRCVVVFPSTPGNGESSDLRASALAPELELLGWRAVFVPAQLELKQRLRILKWERPDIILLQQARHEYNHPKYYPGHDCVFDVDDADILYPYYTERVIECCRGSAAVIAGSRYMAEKLRPYNPNVSVVWTSTYLKPLARTARGQGEPPIVTWAASRPMHSPKEAVFVREVILRLAKLARFRFTLYGLTDEVRGRMIEYIDPIERAGVEVELHPPMGYHQFAASLTTASVGLNPTDVEDPQYFSQGKSFGKLLAYMAAGVPIVMSNVVDHPLFYRNGVNGILLENDPEAWAQACAGILADPESGRRMAAAATADYQRRLSTATAARLVAAQFEAVCAGLNGRGRSDESLATPDEIGATGMGGPST